MTADTFAPWPEPPIVRDLRAKVAAVEALIANAEQRDGRVPCQLLRRAIGMPPRDRKQVPR